MIDKEKQKARGRAYYLRHKEEINAYCKAWREANRANKKGYDRQRLYGLTPKDYNAMQEAQGGGCAICGTKTQKLCVDHNHLCCPGPSTCGQCIRGLLCGNCNRMLGNAHDDPNRLQKAMDYLGR